MLVSFYGFSGVLSWFIINSNQLEVYLTNFWSTESKSGIFKCPLVHQPQQGPKFTTTVSQIDQYSADLCEISSAYVYCCCNIYTVNHNHWLIVIWFTITNILHYYYRIRAVSTVAFTQRGARQTVFGANALALATCFAGTFDEFN